MGTQGQQERKQQILHRDDYSVVLKMKWTNSVIDAKPALLTDDMDKARFGDIVRNWVGPTIGVGKDSACYRKHKPFDSKKMCPLGL
ncbi:hypothetical protein PHMEG_00030158 [Phytophthora megakarya]|uniref:Uncharacterized protein n=1 Tax=Phytophthora megakarya TaxID=4795 RepID=A0A225V1U3_9STRA|nr:hypothetical protein PHMEG_00030158 [Phytophthora megakarya]